MAMRRSLVWTYLAQALSFFVTFSSTVVVARLVSPRDFGIYAMAIAVTTIINVFLQFGLAKYLMRETELSRNLLRSVFTVNVLMSLLYMVMILVGAFAADRLFQSQEVSRFLVVFALFPLFAMMEFIPASLCAREMRFGVVSLLAVVRALVLAAATMILAFKGYAYMSFAWAQVLAWAVTAVCFNYVIWRPDIWRLRFVGMRSILHFGTQMIGISGVGQLSTRAGEMMLGSILGLSSLGLYTRASGLPTSLNLSVFQAASNVIFSKMSFDLRETGSFHSSYLAFLRLVLGVLWPMLLGLAILAQPVIHILYGEKWQAAATPLSLLAIAAAITLALGMTSELFIVRHQTQRQVKLESVRAVVGFILFAGGALISLPAAAAAKIAESIFAFFLYRKPIEELIEGPKGALRTIYSEALILSAAASLPSLILMQLHNWSPLTPALQLTASIGLGGILWAALLWYRRHPIAIEVSRLLGRTTR